jgi:hypothetical protein
VLVPLLIEIWVSNGETTYVVLLKAARARLIGCLETNERHVSFRRRIHNGKPALLHECSVEALDVELELCSGLQRKHAVAVGQERVGPALGLVALALEFGLADGGNGLLDVDVRVVEEAEQEFLAQQFGDGFVDTGFADDAGLHEFEDEISTGFAAELVDARVEDLFCALEFSEVFGAPGARGHVLPRDDAVGDQTPVADDDALEAHFGLEEVGDEALVEARGDFFVLGAHGAAVVGHHLSCSCSNGGLEGDEMVLHVVLPSC